MTILGKSMWKKYNKILVTGCQRSGTRIASEVIAYETGYYRFDENSFGVHSLEIFEKQLKGHKTGVWHCPALAYTIHKYSAPDTAIVWMLRNIEDVLASQKRIDWIGWKSRGEYERYGIQQTPYNREHMYEFKLWCWETFQKDMCHNPIELEYESLKGHPLWLNENDRHYKTA